VFNTAPAFLARIQIEDGGAIGTSDAAIACDFLAQCRHLMIRLARVVPFQHPTLSRITSIGTPAAIHS